MTQFRQTIYARDIIFGAGTLDQLGAAVERFGWRRLLLCTSGSAQRGGRVAQIEIALGERLVAVYDHVQPHVQDFQLAEVLALAETKDVEAVIGLGGGSPIGMAKAVSYTLEAKRTGTPAQSVPPTAQPLIPVVAIPTTYAGSEMTALYGVTYTTENPPRKITVSDPRIAPKLILYDPRLTIDLPPELTAATGINAIAHCIEALYSLLRPPAALVAACEGLRHMACALLRCYQLGDDLEARTEMLVGAHLAGVALAGVTMGLHHGLCHVLGGSAGVPHGIANGIVLPHAMWFNADAAANAGPEWGPRAAEALGLATLSANAAARHVFELIGQLHLPQRLRDAQVSAADLPRLARLACQSRTVQNNPKPVSEIQMTELLETMW
ncbi:MAG: iron-containing alcohol dehydrogenase family protein [Anaerolineales bacterium]